MEETRVKEYLVERTLGDLIGGYPYIRNMFEAIHLDDVREHDTVTSLLSRHPDESFADYGYSKARFAQVLLEFIEEEDGRSSEYSTAVSSITLRGGVDKEGRQEELDLTIRPGEKICLVGPTGSGKSRLLEDIEGLAREDTPTRRTILVNGELPDDEQCFELGHRLVAHLTQNMNFVIDLSVEDFITMHARRLSVEDPETRVIEVIEQANRLSGEDFDPGMAVTQLSGGQSRALMIADIAFLSSSPIVLVDEIENAGIGKEESLDLLVRCEKIVLMATHDPVLALSGDKRLVMENGAVRDVLETSPQEEINLEVLKRVDQSILVLRDGIRSGKRFDSDVRDVFKKILTD